MLKGLPDQWDACSRTVILDSQPLISAHWGDIIALGSTELELLDMITGIRTSVLCGDTSWIYSLTFSQDGTLLMSGSIDGTVRVWDVQTGGVIRTFDRKPWVNSPDSISSDGAVVALGTEDGEISAFAGIVSFPRFSYCAH